MDKSQSQYFLFNSKDEVISDLNYVFAHDQKLDFASYSPERGSHTSWSG